jgi:hypothetical protein
VRFHGGQKEGFRALAMAVHHGPHVSGLRRHYDIIDGEPHGPYREMALARKPR